MKYGKKSSEKRFEKKLVKAVIRLRGICLKFTSPESNGWPDRIVLLPGGLVWWIEIKDEGVEPDELQKMRIKKLKRMGQNALWINSDKNLNEVIAMLKCYER